MATRKVITSDTTVKEPIWDNEKLNSVRALWEIAAIAGNVDPRLQNVKRQKEIAPDWKSGYEEILRRMVDALSPKDERTTGRINYDSSLPFNESIRGDRSQLRATRVDVVSAFKFLETRYGIDSLPEELTALYAHLRQVNASSVTVSNSKPVLVTEISMSPASRDQTKAIETKNTTLLSIVLAAMADELWGNKVDENITDALAYDIQDLLNKHKLKKVYGLSADMVLKAIKRGKILIAQEKRDQIN